MGVASAYSLPMKKKVKKQGQTRISSKHQVTIPRSAFRGAGLEAGDLLRAEANGPGRVVLIRIDELADRYSGCIDSGGELRAQVGRLREEWR